MGTIKKGILNGFSGKVGPVVGAIYTDKCVIKARPKPKSFSKKEMINQAKFKLLQDHILPFKDLLKVGFQNYYTKTGGYRAAVAYTRKVALVTDDSGFYIDPDLVKISGGILEPASKPEVEITNSEEVVIKWDNDDVSYLIANDQIMVLLYDSEQKYAQEIILNGAFRKDGKLNIKLKPRLKKSVIDIYIGFVAADRSIQSDSQYLGRFAV